MASTREGKVNDLSLFTLCNLDFAIIEPLAMVDLLPAQPLKGPSGRRQGSQPLWKSGKTLKMSSFFPSQGKLREFGGKHKKSGEIQGICDSDPEGKGFRQFGACASCAMCPSCIHLLTGYSGFCEYYTPLQTITVGCPRTTS